MMCGDADNPKTVFEPAEPIPWNELKYECILQVNKYN